MRQALILFSFFLCLPICGQQPITTKLFAEGKVFGGTVWAVARDLEGNLLAAGTDDRNELFVSKLDPLLGAIFYKSLKFPANPSAIKFDSANNIYVAGSIGSDGLPNTDSSLQPKLGCDFFGCSAGFLLKLDGSTGEVIFGTYLGGGKRYRDLVKSLSISPDGSIYLAGETDSPNFPITVNAAISKLPDAPAGFVSRLSADGKQLLSSTYVNGAVQAMVMDSSTNTVLLTGTTLSLNSGTEGGYQNLNKITTAMKSVDGGKSWAAIQTPFQTLWLEPDPSNREIVYAGALSGLFVSKDSGFSWQRIGTEFEGRRVRQIRIDPLTPTTIYAVANTQASNLPTTLWKSFDSGQTWKELDFSALFKINQTHPNILYQTDLFSSILISRDGGETWSRTIVQGTTALSAPVVDALNGDIVFIGEYNNGTAYMQRSSNAGVTYDFLGDGGITISISRYNAIPLFSSGPVILYSNRGIPVTLENASYAYGARLSTDGGTSWSSIPLAGTEGFGNPNNANHIFVVGPAGPYFSDDLGAHWTPLRSRLDNPFVTQFSAATSDIFYAVGAAQAGAFVERMESDLSNVTAFTYLGGSAGVTPKAIAIDSKGRTIIAGKTTSRDMPATIGQTKYGGADDGFITRLTADLAKLEFATYAGGSGADAFTSIAVGSDDAIYVAGYAASGDIPLISTNALQVSVNESGGSGLLTILDSDGEIRYSTLLGGSGLAFFNCVVLAGTQIYLGGSVGAPDFFGAPPPSNYRVNSEFGPALVKVDLSKIVKP